MFFVAAAGFSTMACAAPAAAVPTASAPAGKGSSPAAFTSKILKTAVEPGVAVVELTYEFKNTGELPLVVEQFSRNCGCMIGEWDGVPVEPGAAGRIKAKFLTKGLRGVIRKSLHVKFVECGTVELVAEVTIPEAITWSAPTLRWETGGAAQAGEVEIVVRSAAPINVLSATVNDSGFSTSLRTLENGRHYRLTVTPRDTATARVGVVQVRTDSKDPHDALHTFFARVEKAAPSPADNGKGGHP